MSDKHAFADEVGALLFQIADPRMHALLAAHGATDLSELPRGVVGEILRQAVIETAAANFPTANLTALDHGYRSFVHPAFMPAWDRVRSLTATGDDPFSMASGVDAAALLAGFGLPVAAFDFGYGALEKPSNEIDRVLKAFSRWRTAFVGCSVCDAPFYVLLTNCVQTLRRQIASHPELSDIGRVFARTCGSLPSATRKPFESATVIFTRLSRDLISSVQLTGPSHNPGSIMLYAGWKVGGQPSGAPYNGHLPCPLSLLRAVAYDHAVAYSLCQSVGWPRLLH